MLLGSVQSMITTLKNNSRKKEKSHFNYTGISGKLSKLNKKKMSPEKFLQFKTKLKKEKKRNIIIRLSIFLISTLLTILCFDYVLKI